MDERKIKNFHHEGECPVRDILCRFGDKWSVLVLVSLKVNGTLRFSELARSLGDISQRMLTVTLRSLEQDGLVERTLYAEVPPRVEYALTEMGRDLMPHIESLIAWSLDHTSQILSNREQFRASSPISKPSAE